MAKVLRLVLLAVLLIAALCGSALLAVEPGKPSVSALEVTAYRAIGAKHPDPAIRNGDTLAAKFLGADERAILRKAGSEVVLRALELDTERAWQSLGVRAGFAMAIHVRTRHMDKAFTDALQDGAAQVVVLGAGLDSRAYRFNDALRSARVFEVDFPPPRSTRRSASVKSFIRYPRMSRTCR